MMKIEIFARYILGAIIAVIGFLLAQIYNRSVDTLTTISKDLVAIKLDIVELKSTMITEEKVKDILYIELQRNGLLK